MFGTVSAERSQPCRHPDSTREAAKPTAKGAGLLEKYGAQDDAAALAAYQLVAEGRAEAVWNQMAELCCSCGLCTLYACPEDLYPKEACDKAKVEMKEAGIKFIQQKSVNVHPIKDGRRVPLKQLIMKLKI